MKIRSYDFIKGFIRENPTFVLVLGLCPSLAVSTKVVYALGMGLSTMVVLVFSNILISMLRKVIPDEIHIPVYIVIIASFVTVVDLLLQAYAEPLSRALGVYVQLIVVNCIILGRAEAFACKHTVTESLVDGISMGIGFTFGLLLIATIREILGNGSITLIERKLVIEIPVLFTHPARVIAYPAGALLVLGYLKGFFNWLTAVLDARKSLKGAMA
jgi:electron transport complex protein RnfE